MATTFATLFIQTRKLHEESRVLRADAAITVSESKEAITRARHTLERIGHRAIILKPLEAAGRMGLTSEFDSRLFSNA